MRKISIYIFKESGKSVKIPNTIKIIGDITFKS